MVILDRQGNVIRDAMLWNDVSSAPQAAALIEKMGAAPAVDGEPEDPIARGKQTLGQGRRLLPPSPPTR